MKEQSAAPNARAGSHRRPSRRTPSPDVVSITNAAEAHSADMSRRMKKYLITMGIRMVCLAAIFVFDGWYKLIPIVGAVLLPWVAVIIANGGSDISQQENVDLLDAAPPLEVESPTPAPDDVDPLPGDILTGEIVPDDEDPPPASAQTNPGTHHP